MSRKAIAIWATLMIVIFGVTVVVYPLIFNTQKSDHTLPAPQVREVPLPSGPVGPGAPAAPVIK